MFTDHSRGRAPGGFTLIEVLISLVLLGVGFLAVEALGITAARSIAMANRNSEYAVGTSHYMEVALDSIRLGATGSGAFPTCGTLTVDATLPTHTVQRTVAFDPPSQSVSVTVTAVPNSSASLQPAPFAITNVVYIADDETAPTAC